jgi:xylulokinase
MALLLGIDLGTSFIKVSVIDAQTGRCLASARNSETEAPIIAAQPSWAEQCPNQWWEDVKAAIMQAHSTGNYDPKDIAAIGIAYQMHGLVLVDKNQQVLRNSIIWCDSRAVDIGNKAFEKIGEAKCLERLLNSPGNFTASKLSWVRNNEPIIYSRIHKIMLPGDFIAMKLTGEITTTPSALSEGVFWDFKKGALSKDIMKFFGFEQEHIPVIEPVFAEHGALSAAVARQLSLPVGIPVSYKAGDQLNNALSLNVMKPGEMAATAGTSGVIYAVTDQLTVDKRSRVNTFAHVNHTEDKNRLGVLLCINGCGIMNSYVRKLMAPDLSYEQMNSQAAQVPAGSEGLKVLPFGNGAERMLENKAPGAHFLDLNLNRHSAPHFFRAVQEGIAFAFRYGVDIMRENGIDPRIIRAGKANLFLSEVFLEAFVNSTGLEVELYQNDGSVGAAIGAGIGAGIYNNPEEAFTNLRPIQKAGPSPNLYVKYEIQYHKWLRNLKKQLPKN